MTELGALPGEDLSFSSLIGTWLLEQANIPPPENVKKSGISKICFLSQLKPYNFSFVEHLNSKQIFNSTPYSTPSYIQLSLKVKVCF